MTGPDRAPRRPLGRRLPETCSGWAAVAMLVIRGSFMSGYYRDAMSRRGGVAPAESPGSPAVAAVGAQPSWSAASSARELGPSLLNTLRRWKSTVRAKEQLCGGVPLDRPCRTRAATALTIDPGEE